MYPDIDGKPEIIHGENYNVWRIWWNEISNEKT